MTDLFGLSLNLVMYVLLFLLAVSLASIAFVGLRNRIMFKMGIRNLPRRRAQTVLIIVGLMLSTVIISAAFTTGDTVNQSITSQVYGVMGSLDEIVQIQQGDSEADFEDSSTAGLRQPAFPAASVSTLVNQLRSSDDIDLVIPAYDDVAVGLNANERLSTPLFNVLGLDPAAAADLNDIIDVNGGRLHVTDLGANEIFINKSAADELNLKEGDTLTLITFGKQTTWRVKAIVENKRLAGAGGISVRKEGGVLPLSAAQTLFNAPDQLTMLAVSNKGDARGGYTRADTVESQINDAIASQRRAAASFPDLGVQTIKKTGVDIAEQASSLFTTFFLVLGLFSIGAGVLLIFMIFVMLAAERKSEMGMARAIGTKRGDIVQTFLSEGMAYNVLAALVGTGLGVVVAFLISQAMAKIFASADIQISPHVTARSLIISYSLGVVLTFLTVTVSSWRVSYINIVRAIRDIPEPPAEKPNWGRHGFFSAVVGLVIKRGSGKEWLLRLGLFVLGIFFFVGGISSGATLGAVLGGMVGGLTFVYAVFRTVQTGLLFLVIGAAVLLVFYATDSSSAFVLLLGLSLLPLGLALVTRSFGANDRLVYTLAGLVLLYIWEFDFSVGLIDRVFGKTNGDIEMFFLSGVMVTVAATFLVVYNADLILGPLTRLGRGLGALLPSIKMAVAYPLASKSRTGMTMAMFCLVVFALTMMSSMIHNFNRLYLSDRSLGGYQVSVDENPTNPIGDLRAALRSANASVVNDIENVGVVSIAVRSTGRACQVNEGVCDASALANDDNLHDYWIWGDDAAFLGQGTIPLQQRANGYSDDGAVWKALASDPSLAVIDSNGVVQGSGGFDSFGFLHGIDGDKTTFDPVGVTLIDEATGKSANVKVIGVIETGASANYMALHIQQATFESVYGAPDARRFYVKLASGTNATDAAREIESALLTTGAQAESLRKVLNDAAATQNGFFYLMQGFMGLGLFVGVAAVGVIAFRTVVERRQQIGMLRAIGYTKNMIGLTFLIESAFIAFMGVVSGIVFAVILARQLINDEFANQGVHSFAVPWMQIGMIGGLAFGFALLMTLIPSRQAAGIPIAEALRYE